MFVGIRLFIAEKVVKNYDFFVAKPDDRES